MQLFCKKCKNSKDISCFSKNRNKKFGVNNICKPCSKIYGDVYRDQHRQYKKIENIIYVNPEGIECIEEWKYIRNYEGLYMVSNLGRVKSTHFKSGDHLLKPSIKTKYARIAIVSNGERINLSVHRLVGDAFLDNPENKPDINHKFGDTQDNRYFMIEWATKKENSQHALKTGLNWNVGENSILAKLSGKEALEICNSKTRSRILAQKYNVTEACINMIKSGKNWGYITGKKYERKNKISKENILNIFNSTMDAFDLSELFKIERAVIWNIKSGRSYSKITGKKRLAV